MVLKMALDHGLRGPGNLPETRYIQPAPRIPSKGKTFVPLAVGVAVLGSMAGWIGGRLSDRRR